MGLSSIVSKASAVVGGSPSHGHQQQHGTTTTSSTSPSSSALSGANSQDKAPEGASADDTEVLDDEPKNS
ncbi:hypothetical protein JCM16303_003091 [Sporobolomyces ruberrimus]